MSWTARPSKPYETYIFLEALVERPPDAVALAKELGNVVDPVTLGQIINGRSTQRNLLLVQRRVHT